MVFLLLSLSLGRVCRGSKRGPLLLAALLCGDAVTGPLSSGPFLSRDPCRRRCPNEKRNLRLDKLVRILWPTICRLMLTEESGRLGAVIAAHTGALTQVFCTGKRQRKAEVNG